jgi:hypothetical protein
MPKSKPSHLKIIKDANGTERLEWDWNQLARDVNEAVKTYEYSKLSKKELEDCGRKLGIELDRRKSASALVKQLIEFELNSATK